MVRTVGHLPGAAHGRLEGVAVSGTAPVGSGPSVVDVSPQYDLNSKVSSDLGNIECKLAWQTTVTVA